MVGQGRTLIRASLTAKQRLQEMAQADGITAAALLHRLVMVEWERRTNDNGHESELAYRITEVQRA